MMCDRVNDAGQGPLLEVGSLQERLEGYPRPNPGPLHLIEAGCHGRGLEKLHGFRAQCLAFPCPIQTAVDDHPQDASPLQERDERLAMLFDEPRNIEAAAV